MASCGKRKLKLFAGSSLCVLVPRGVFVAVCSYSITVQSSSDLRYTVIFPEYLIAVVKPVLEL